MNYLPKSPRNRIMYYLYADSLYPGTITTTISELLKIDNNEQSVIADDLTNITNDEQSQPSKNAENMLLTYSKLYLTFCAREWE